MVNTITARRPPRLTGKRPGKILMFKFQLLEVGLMCCLVTACSSPVIPITQEPTIPATSTALPTPASIRIFILTMPLISHQQAIIPTATAIIIPTQEPASKSITIPNAINTPAFACDCSRDYDCKDFDTQRQAQTCYNDCGGNNWSRLDGDDDGRACESLP